MAMVSKRIVFLALIFLLPVMQIMADGEGHGEDHDSNSQKNVSESIHIDTDDVAHIHGIAYSSDGNRMTIAAHDGIRVYAEGQWSFPDVPYHDYMGFTPIDEGFYSSGHPSPLSQLVNPLGLVKVTEGGRKLEILAFSGESDFHLLAAGYYSHAIYLGNFKPNSRLNVGVFYSLDEGKSWTRSRRLAGLPRKTINQIAVHPKKSGTVALATSGGIFFSSDFGASFYPLYTESSVSAVYFSPDGSQLFYARRSLWSYSLEEKKERSITVPELAAADYLTDIAVNPSDANKIVVVTKNKNIFLSDNLGEEWVQILREGRL